MTPLSIKLKALVAKFPERAEEIHRKADELDKRNDEFMTELDNAEASRRLLGAWARARRLYCELTGESLI